MIEGKKEILLGDCLELMKDIPNGSIDMILCDLPYGTTACKWDCVLPLEQLWAEYKRLIKPNGVIVLTASQPFTSVLTCSNLDWFKYEWIWLKNQGSNFATVKYQPMKEHESVLVFANGKTTYNPIMQPRTKSAQERLKYDITEYKGEKREVFGGLKDNGKNMSYNKDERNPASYQFFEVVPRHKGTLHPTQKPVALFEYLIKTYSNDGDLILDNCAGCGTTAIACLNTNRQFIVMEKEQKYYDIILKRVADFNKNFEPKTLFGNEM